MERCRNWDTRDVTQTPYNLLVSPSHQLYLLGVEHRDDLHLTHNILEVEPKAPRIVAYIVNVYLHRNVLRCYNGLVKDTKRI